MTHSRCLPHDVGLPNRPCSSFRRRGERSVRRAGLPSLVCASMRRCAIAAARRRPFAVPSSPRRPAIFYARHFLSGSSLKPEQLDAAIAEMNAEMSELFGEPMGEVGISESLQPPLTKHAAASPNVSHAAAPTAARPQHTWASSEAASALSSHIELCREELARVGTNDLSRGLLLAQNIESSARALQALTNTDGAFPER